MKHLLLLLASFTLAPAAHAASVGNECRTDADCENGFYCEGASNEAAGTCVNIPDDPNPGPIVAPAFLSIKPNKARSHAFIACNS